MSSLKILTWSARGSGRQYGGPGMAAWRMYSEMAEADGLVDLLHCYPEQSSTFPYRRTISAVRYPSFAANVANAVAKTARLAADYDVVHALTGYLPSLAIAASARMRGAPTAIKIAGLHSDFARMGPLKQLLAKKVAAYIAISSEIATELLTNGVPATRIVRIPNGTDVKTFAPANAEDKSALKAALGLNSDIFTIVYTGALVRRKRPHLLIEAARLLSDKGIRTQLCLVGPFSDAAYYAELRLQAQATEPSVDIRFPGHVTDIHRYYQAADVFCLPSEREGMPNALIEAMATGLPSVVTSASGVRDLIAMPDQGMIVEDNSTAISAALVSLHKSHAARADYGANARTRILSKFDRSLTLKAHLELFKRLRDGRQFQDLHMF